MSTQTQTSYSIYRDYKNTFDEKELKKLSEILTDEFGKEIVVTSIKHDDGEELVFLIKEE